MSLVCIFYTLLVRICAPNASKWECLHTNFRFPFKGGIKAVVFTDAWQVVVMFISVVVVVIIGTIAVGGLDVIWERSMEGGRIDFFK